MTLHSNCPRFFLETQQKQVTMSSKEKEVKELAKRVGKIAEEVFLVMCKTDDTTTGVCFEISDFGKSIELRRYYKDNQSSKKQIEICAIPHRLRTMDLETIVNTICKMEEEVKTYK